MHIDIFIRGSMFAPARNASAMNDIAVDSKNDVGALVEALFAIHRVCVWRHHNFPLKLRP